MKEFSTSSCKHCPNKSSFSPRAPGPSRGAKGNIPACEAIRKRARFSAHLLKRCVQRGGEQSFPRVILTCPLPSRGTAGGRIEAIPGADSHLGVSRRLHQQGRCLLMVSCEAHPDADIYLGFHIINSHRRKRSGKERSPRCYFPVQMLEERDAAGVSSSGSVTKRGFSPLKHPEKEASERIPGGQPGQWGTPPWGEQGARSCYQEVLQALGTASSSAQPFITSP